MADPRINATFTATDKVTPVVKGMRAEVTKLGSKTGGPLGGLLGGIGGLNLGMVGLGVGVVGAVGAMGDFVKAAIDENINIAKVSAALKANVPDWQAHTAEIDKAVSAAEDLAFTDDAARQSLALLLPTTHNVAEAVKLMGIAMNLSRLRGTDLAETTTLIGKVYQGNLSSLKRFGISLKGVSNSTEALAKVQAISAGQATAYANTEAGTLEKLNIKFNDLKEDIGHGIVNAIADLGNAFNNLHRAIDPNTAVMQDMEVEIRKQATALGIDADAAVAFYEAQTKATEVAKANAQAIQDQAIAAEIAANANETMYDVALKLNVSIADVIRVSNGMVTSTQQVADYTQSAAGVVNQYAKSLQGLSDAEAYHHRNDYLKDDLKVSSEALRGYEGAWRGAAINIPAAISDMRIATHAQFKDLLSQDKKDLKQLIHDINHPGESKNLLKWLPKAMTKAQDALHTAQTTGDQVAIAEAQALVDKLNAQFQLLHGPTTVSVHIAGGGGRMATRAGGGPVSSGSTYLVGEHGPEVLHMGGGGGGQITQGSGGMSGGGGHTTLVYLNGDLIAKQVDDYQGRRWSNAGTGRSRN